MRSSGRVSLWILCGVVAVALMFTGVVLAHHSLAKKATVFIGGDTFRVKVVTTKEQCARGLGGADRLASNEGMVFDCGGPTAKIWMKDMRFPIDVLWLDTKGVVVHMESSLQPNTYPKMYGPDAAARYVVELPSGIIAKKAVYVGMELRIDWKGDAWD